MVHYSYSVIVEKADGNFSAYAPDLPGCVAAGDTVAETLREMQAAIALHLAGLAGDLLPIPKPSSIARQIDVELPAA